MSFRRLTVLLVTLAAAGPTWALAPRRVPDWELAEQPVVVLAHWARAPMKPHSRVSGGLLEKHEIRTRLVVDRVLKGEIKPGEHPLLLAFGFAWDQNGRNFYTYTSTMVPADVADVTRPALWFLSRSRSWDTKDRTEYLHLDTYRGVQNATLEPYFRILMGKDRNSTVGELLKSADPEVVSHALRFIHAGRPAWPFTDSMTDFLNPRDPKIPTLTQHAPRIAAALPNLSASVRPEAAAVYASLTGKECVATMRGLLSDRDPVVRAVAVGALSRNRDRSSIPAFAKAVAGLKGTPVSLQVIKRLESWGDPELVPALITFLDNGEYYGMVGDDLLFPNFMARKALVRITGYWFPLKAAKSLDAWQASGSAASLVERRQLLIKRLGANVPPRWRR